jgi:hydrogenase maturation protease
VHQLTPELAEEIAQSRTVVFIDASVESAGNGVQMRELEPSTTAEWRAHGSDPCRLMALARALYGHCPRAWLVTVSGTQFEIGAELSPAARHGVELAVARILDLIDPGEPAEGPNQGNV